MPPVAGGQRQPIGSGDTRNQHIAGFGIAPRPLDLRPVAPGPLGAAPFQRQYPVVVIRQYAVNQRPELGAPPSLGQHCHAILQFVHHHRRHPEVVRRAGQKCDDPRVRRRLDQLRYHIGVQGVLGHSQSAASA